MHGKIFGVFEYMLRIVKSLLTENNFLIIFYGCNTPQFYFNFCNVLFILFKYLIAMISSVYVIHFSQYHNTLCDIFIEIYRLPVKELNRLTCFRSTFTLSKLNE